MNNEYFSKDLFEKMKLINQGISDLEFYEFEYLLKRLSPENKKWESVEAQAKEKIEKLIEKDIFYSDISVNQKMNGKTVLHKNITALTRNIFAGMAQNSYNPEWINKYFYFDIRSFIFYPRTFYFNDPVKKHLGGKPFKSFEKKQKIFESYQGIGYKDFMNANMDIDNEFISILQKLITIKGTPVVIGIAGPTAAGKTEIVERLKSLFKGQGRIITTIEMDNFFTDRETREKKGIHSMGKEALHFNLLLKAIKDISEGRKIFIPEYDYLTESSSFDESGNLKEGRKAIEINPSDIIFIEGNFPFLFEELVQYIGIKIVYLTDDPVRLKRKWKRDIDYLKKYEQIYFINRYFRTQKLKAKACYIPQLCTCDIAVYTTGSELWLSRETSNILEMPCQLKL